MPRWHNFLHADVTNFDCHVDTHAMRIPKIYHFGSLSSKGSFIVMEYLKFGGSYSQAGLGQALAEMHKAEPAVSDTCSQTVMPVPASRKSGHAIALV